MRLAAAFVSLDLRLTRSAKDQYAEVDVNNLPNYDGIIFASPTRCALPRQHRHH